MQNDLLHLRCDAALQMPLHPKCRTDFELELYPPSCSLGDYSKSTSKNVKTLFLEEAHSFNQAGRK